MQVQYNIPKSSYSWALQYEDGSIYPYLCITRKEARDIRLELNETFGESPKVIKVQIQVLN